MQFVDLGTDVDYLEAWDVQRAIHAEVADGTRPATTLLLEHAPVFTAGRRTEAADRPLDGSPVVDVDRGGKITWHGPGQLVAYPIVRLPEAVGVVDHVRRLEEAIMATLASFGLRTRQVPGRSGVWLGPDERGGERKIAAIGIRVSRATTLHGLSLNVSNTLAAYDRIVACGIRDAGVTTLATELGEAAPTVAEVAECLRPELAARLRSVDPSA